jgi:hypothetical protein
MHSFHQNSLLRWKPCKRCRGATCDTMQQSAGGWLCTHAHFTVSLSVPQLPVAVLSLFPSLVSFHLYCSLRSTYSHRLQADRPRNRASLPGTAYKTFLLLHILGVGPTQLSSHGVSQAKRSKPEPGSIYTYTPPYPFMVRCLLTHSFCCLAGALSQ